MSECELSVRAQHPPLGLYLKGEWPGRTAWSWSQWLLAVGKDGRELLTGGVGRPKGSAGPLVGPLADNQGPSAP